MTTIARLIRAANRKRGGGGEGYNNLIDDLRCRISFCNYVVHLLVRNIEITTFACSKKSLDYLQRDYLKGSKDTQN